MRRISLLLAFLPADIDRSLGGFMALSLASREPELFVREVEKSLGASWKY